MTRPPEPPLIIAADAERSTLPIRHAAAVVLHDERGLVLLAHRSQLVTEFRGVWSFPSASSDTATSARDDLTRGIDNWFGLTATNWQLCARRLALRPAWRLEMSLYIAGVAMPPQLLAPKYDQLRWAEVAKVLATIGDGAGDCMLAFKEYIDRAGDAAFSDSRRPGR